MTSSKKILLLITVCLFLSSGQAHSDSIPDTLKNTITHMDIVKGIYSDSRGYRVRLDSPHMRTILRTNLGYIEKPKVWVYLPNQNYPILIQSKILKVDRLRQDFIFQDNVVLKLKNGILKTNFLKINTKREEFTSFDLYTFSLLPPRGKTIQGQSFYGSIRDQKIQFLGIKNATHKRSFCTPLL